jgi:hypothetical protein
MAIVWTGELNGFRATVQYFLFGDFWSPHEPQEDGKSTIPVVSVGRRRHGTLGLLCGYLYLPKGHKYHGTPYDAIPIDVYARWSFSELATDGTWKIGFDTGHHSGYVGFYDRMGTPDKVRNELLRVSSKFL